MDEDAKTFIDCWQHLADGGQVGFVDEDAQAVPTPANYSIYFREQTGDGVPVHSEPNVNSPPAE
jgi:hypothetical protein